jgi:hypothetical protein
MEKITSFRQLLVWQKSMNLAARCYETASDDQWIGTVDRTRATVLAFAPDASAPRPSQP